MVNEQVQNAARIAHDVGLATWFGGQVFGKFALNPVVKVIDDPPTRGKVVNSGWFSFNPIGVAGLGAATAVRVAARLSELLPPRQTPAERKLSLAEDGLLATSVLLTAVTGVQGARLAKQAPGGAVPIESGTEPSPDTPPQASRLQRSIGALGNGALFAGLGVVSLRAVQDRLAYSRPPARRGLMRLRSA
jgi:hypothetical protein